MGLAVLGPVRLDGPAGPVAIEGRKARQLLTVLALAAPRPMSLDSLTRSLWDDPPPAAAKTVQAHLSRLRTALAAARPRVGSLTGSTAGYRLVADAGALDVLVVDDLRRQARLASLRGDDQEAETLLRQTRELWHGDPRCRRPSAAAPRAIGWPSNGSSSSRITSRPCWSSAGPPRRSSSSPH
jgi:DNA-binding SARP family transcriptional activator